jgi:hypothetical protein
MNKLVPFIPSHIFFFKEGTEKGSMLIEQLPLAVEEIGDFALPVSPHPGSLEYDIQHAKQFSYGRLFWWACVLYYRDGSADVREYQSGVGGCLTKEALQCWLALIPGRDISKSPFLMGFLCEVEELTIEWDNNWLRYLTPEKWNKAAHDLFSAKDEAEMAVIFKCLKCSCLDLKNSIDKAGGNG